ncbi:MAG: nucleoside 2-deoxyribosyltransferase [Syntrophobacteraceae bacterium]
MISCIPAVNILIALLDGPQVDDGAAWEIGYFYAKRRPEQKIIGIRTDFRRAGRVKAL